MITALEGVGGSASRPGRSLPPGKTRYPFTGGWVGPKAGLDRCEKSRPTGIRPPDRPARSQSLDRLRYPALGRCRSKDILRDVKAGDVTTSNNKL